MMDGHSENIVTRIKRKAREYIRTPFPRFPEEPAELTDFFEGFFTGERIACYEDNRRVPLELFHNRYRLLLISQNPKQMRYLQGARGYRNHGQIFITQPGPDGTYRDLKPARWRAWHDHPLVARHFPVHPSDPRYYSVSRTGITQECEPEIADFLRACRAGLQPFFKHATGLRTPEHIDPDVFDHPLAIHLLSAPGDPRRKLVRTRWRRAIRGPLMTYDTPRIRSLANLLMTLPPEERDDMFGFHIARKPAQT